MPSLFALQIAITFHAYIKYMHTLQTLQYMHATPYSTHLPALLLAVFVAE